MYTGHIDDGWLLQLIAHRFPLRYEGPPNPSNSIIHPNHVSGRNYDNHVAKFIEKEMANQTLIGPFDDIPFVWANVTPIMTRLKADPGKQRIIVDYSFPDGGINDSIKWHSSSRGAWQRRVSKL